MIVDCINNDTIINIDNDGVMKEYWQRYKYRFININIKYWYIRIHKYKFYRTWKKENWKMKILQGNDNCNKLIMNGKSVIN